MNKRLFISCLVFLCIGFVPANAQTQAFKDALRRAYITGKAEDQYKVATLYNELQGDGNPFSGFLVWCSKAARQGYIPAALWLGECYFNGMAFQGGRFYRDYSTALHYYKIAANQGDAKACYFTGRIFRSGGYGVEQDFNQAFQWMKLGADRGYTDAMNELSYLYALGKGVAKSMINAHKCIDRALSINPNDVNYIDTKGELYLMEGDRVNARKMYDRCIQLNKNWGNQRTALYRGLFE